MLRQQAAEGLTNLPNPAPLPDAGALVARNGVSEEAVIKTQQDLGVQLHKNPLMIHSENTFNKVNNGSLEASTIDPLVMATTLPWFSQADDGFITALKMADQISATAKKRFNFFAGRDKVRDTLHEVVKTELLVPQLGKMLKFFKENNMNSQ